MTDVKIAAARAEQSKSDKADLLDRLKNKKRKTASLRLVVDDEPVEMKFSAISARELDALRAKHPPTKAQQAEGLGVNMDTFAPALVSATLTEPKMTEDDARDIWASDFWSRGELAQIFEVASAVCLDGLDVPPSASA